MRIEVTFRGRVQGVGFRWIARSLAELYGIRGFVLNQSDGSVFLVSEGDGDSIELFLNAILARLGTYVTEAEYNREALEEGLTTFEIRHSL